MTRNSGADRGSDGTPREADAAGKLAELVANRTQLLGFVERRVRNHDLAEEILQEAFARGLQRVGQVRSGDRTVAWFYRLLRCANGCCAFAERTPSTAASIVGASTTTTVTTVRSIAVVRLHR
jgi:hypothetical protein